MIRWCIKSFHFKNSKRHLRRWNERRPLVAMVLTVIFYDSVKFIMFKILKAPLKKESFLKNLKFQKLFQFLKRWNTSNQFLFFQFFPKCLNVLCIIVCMNISWITIYFTNINLVFKWITKLSIQYYSLHKILPKALIMANFH